MVALEVKFHTLKLHLLSTQLHIIMIITHRIEGVILEDTDKYNSTIRTELTYFILQK